MPARPPATPSDAGALLAGLARDPLRPYYLLHGDEWYLVERALTALRARLADTATERLVWGDDPGSALFEALDELGSPLLFGGTPFVVVRRADALPKATEDELVDRLETLGGSGRLVLVARTLDGRRRLLGASAKAGAAFGFARVTDPAALRTWVVRAAREAGCEIASPAIERVLERHAGDLGSLVLEIEKLALVAGSGARIERAHVDATMSVGRSDAVERLSDQLARGQLGEALDVLRGLLAAGEPPIRIVAFLASNLRRALHVAELRDAGLGDAAIADRLRMPAWLLRKTRPRPARELERGLEVLRQLDLDLKRSRPAAASLEAAVTALSSPISSTRRS
jgi:DNA polymerase-3 subunit delta